MERKRKNKGKKNSKRLTELSADCLVCPKGLLDQYIRHGAGELDTYTMVFRQDGTLTSDGSGTLNTVWSNNPSPSANWTGAAAVYDEYRTLMYRVEFEPIMFNGQVIAQAPIAICVDMDTSTALTAYSLAAQYSSDKVQAGGKRWHIEAYMSGVPTGQFISTGSPVANCWIKSYSTGNSVSVTLGRYLVSYLIQFRGKGI